MTTIGIVSLGCPRNLVDSEVLLGLLRKNGFKISDIELGVDVAIVNTCGFIKDAKEESIDVILQASQLKKEGKVKTLVVAGCLAQRYADEIANDLPEVDAFVGTSDFVKIPGIIRGLAGTHPTIEVSKVPRYLYDGTTPREVITQKHFVYIKISEGCDNKCSYCVIPSLRGPLRSRTVESVLREARQITTPQLREINIIGQDITLFGAERYRRPMLSALLGKICGENVSVGWIRLLYTHPAHYTDELIECIAREKKICNYLDLPIQHCSDRILKEMNRRVSKAEIVGLIQKIRTKIPRAAIRTSIIVGFPGETEKEFSELLRFMREIRFERLGAFMYSREEGTKAHGLEGQIPEEEKKRRFDEVMRTQQVISEEKNKGLIGKELTVLIDEKEGGRFFGRTEWDAPEVDGGVYVSGKNARLGEFCRARITDTFEYDLVGEALP
ncbi:MAG: 30S ribosomal protein S12 methylthiotransferase RimO [Candidatus Omnitrophota bacterium]